MPLRPSRGHRQLKLKVNSQSIHDLFFFLLIIILKLFVDRNRGIVRRVLLQRERGPVVGEKDCHQLRPGRGNVVTVDGTRSYFGRQRSNSQRGLKTNLRAEQFYVGRLSVHLAPFKINADTFSCPLFVFRLI